MLALNLRRLAMGGLAVMLAASAQAQAPSAPNDPAVVVAPEATPIPATETPPVDVPTPQTDPVAPQPVPQVEPQPEPKPKPVKKGPPDSLKPGQFVWEKRDSYANPLRMVIVLDIQRMYVFDGDDLVGFTTVSTGKKGKENAHRGVQHPAEKSLPRVQYLRQRANALHAAADMGWDCAA